MFQGLRSVIYEVRDLARAKAWYAEAFGVQPYFDQPFYVGFEIGGYELGLHPGGDGVVIGSNVTTYWGVPDIEAAHARMLERGAAPREAITDVGEGIKVASVADPFGNLIGLIYNPHFAAKG
jgi:predicted enzyme related to lactoylglutathione lyase